MKSVLKNRIKGMSEDELLQAMYTDPLTGVWNRSAFSELIEKQLGVNPRTFVAIVDLDSLKWINDNISHRAGDSALRTVADQLEELFPGRTFRLSGDEFIVYGSNRKEIRIMLDLENRIFSYGVGWSLEEADGDLQNDKSERESRGERSARGIKPPWMFEGFGSE